MKDMKDYYYRVFAIAPDGKVNSLSRISYRLAAILIKELNFFTPKKLPQRKKLSQFLNVSHQAILDSLSQLEDAGFIIRTHQMAEIIRADSDEQEKANINYNNYFKTEQKSRRFNDDFYLNYYYNMTIEKQVYGICKDIVIRSPDQVFTYQYLARLPESLYNKNLLTNIINDLLEKSKDAFSKNIDDSLISHTIEDILNKSKALPGNKEATLFYIAVNDENSFGI